MHKTHGPTFLFCHPYTLCSQWRTIFKIKIYVYHLPHHFLYKFPPKSKILYMHFNLNPYPNLECTSITKYKQKNIAGISFPVQYWLKEDEYKIDADIWTYFNQCSPRKKKLQKITTINRLLHNKVCTCQSTIQILSK